MRVKAVHAESPSYHGATGPADYKKANITANLIKPQQSVFLLKASFVIDYVKKILHIHNVNKQISKSKENRCDPLTLVSQSLQSF